MKEGKKFNPEIALWPTRDGKYSRIAVTAAVYDIIQRAEIGTSLLLMPVPENVKEQIEANGKNAPNFRLVILPADNGFKPHASTTKSKATKSKATKTEAEEEDI